VIVKIISTEGCTSYDTLNIEVFEDSQLEVFNVFTPDGKGGNEEFKVRYKGDFPEFRMEIFNRWGNKLYETNVINNGWDGNGEPAGTYYYIIFARASNGKEYNYRGPLTMIK